MGPVLGRLRTGDPVGIFRLPYPCSRLGTLNPSRKFESRHSPHSFSRGYSYFFKGSHLKFRTCIVFSYKPPRMPSLLRGSLWASSLTKALFFPKNSPLFHNSNDHQLTRFCRPSIQFPTMVEAHDAQLTLKGRVGFEDCLIVHLPHCIQFEASRG